MAEKTDWSFIDKRKRDSEEIKKSETSQTDWSFVDDRKKNEKTSQTNIESPRSNSQNVDDLIKQQGESLKKEMKQIAVQEYEKAKSAAEKFRREHGWEKSEEELQEEDTILRKKFGIE